MRRILGYTVARNEADRYLESCLSWASTFLDGIFLFDDQSTDTTPHVAASLGCNVKIRDDSIPSFLEHEGRFREAAWRAFEECFKLTSADWVLSFDADEFLVSEGDIRTTLDEVATHAEARSAMGVVIPIPEVFDVDDHEGQLVNPQVRVDGWWGKISGFRYFHYQSGGEFSNKRMACGAEPTYVSSSVKVKTKKLFLLHYGYAVAQDRAGKYQRYTAQPEGHSNAHVQSIIDPPTLRPWPGPSLPVWRGSESVRKRLLLNDTIDVVTIAHTDSYYDMAIELQTQLKQAHVGDDRWTFTIVDNRIQNRGFAKGCNLGAEHTTGGIIGFLNPDVIVKGSFFDKVRESISDGFVVVGENFDKPSWEYRDIWQCREWVCGSCFFVRRSWWDVMGGFDTKFVWSWEETDFIRRTQKAGGEVKAMKLAVSHESPSDDSDAVQRYKENYFNEGARLFRQRWFHGH